MSLNIQFFHDYSLLYGISGAARIRGITEHIPDRCERVRPLSFVR